MGQKYHINAQGVPALCRATKGNCPFGGADGQQNHFDNIEDAQKAADKINAAKFDILPGSKSEELDYKTKDDLENLKGKDVEVEYDGKSFAGTVIGTYYDSDGSGNNGVIIQSTSGDVKHIKARRITDFNAQGEGSNTENYPEVFDRYAGEYNDYFKNIDSISPDEAKQASATGILERAIDKKDPGNEWLEGELDAYYNGSIEEALEDPVAFMNESVIGGGVDMPDFDSNKIKYDRVREELQIAVDAAGDYIDNVNSGMSPREAQEDVEAKLVDRVSSYFNPGNGIFYGEDGIPPLNRIGEKLSDSEIRQAGQLFENIVSRDKAYRFMEDSGGYAGEVLYDEQKKIFGKSNAKKDKIGDTAMDAAQMFYHSPLYGGSINTGKNIRKVRERYEDWLRTDGQKSD